MFDLIREQGYNINSFLVLLDGEPIVETYNAPYGAETMHHVYSVTKSFISTLVGLAITDGSIESVDQPIVELLPTAARPSGGPEVAAVTVRHALTMTCGFQWGETRSRYTSRSNPVQEMQRTRDWARYVLERRVVAAPGARFEYSSGASHLLATALRNATGTSVASYAERRLFQPLGITSYSWTADPQGTHTGGWGLYLRPRDMAKLGTLYLNEGRWNGDQVVPENWVRESTSRHVEATPADGGPLGLRTLARRLRGGSRDDDRIGYGYQWWLPSFGGQAALGAGGQAVYVLPREGAVVAMTGGLSRDQAPLRHQLMKRFVLPELRSLEPAGGGRVDPRALPANGRAEGLARRRPPSLRRPATAELVSGQRYVFGNNASGIRSISIDFRRDDTASLEILFHDRAHDLIVGLDDVYRSNGIDEQNTLALRGSWTAERTFDLEWCWVSSGERLEISLRYSGERLSLRSRGAIDGRRFRIVGRRSP